MSSEPLPERDLSKLLAFRTEDLPELIPLSLSYIKELIRTGEIQSLKIGGARIIPRWAVEQFLQTPNPTTEPPK